MEAPEKLYVDTENRLSDSILYGFTERKDGDIEYVRKDVFIEKACKYFRTKKKCVFACIGEDVYQSLLNEEEIEDFKNYMKGE